MKSCDVAYCIAINQNWKQKSYPNSFRITAHEIFVINCYKPSCSEQKLARSNDFTILYIQSDGNQASAESSLLSTGPSTTCWLSHRFEYTWHFMITITSAEESELRGLLDRIPKVILNWENDEGCNNLNLITCSRWRECKCFPERILCCLKVTL